MSNSELTRDDIYLVIAECRHRTARGVIFEHSVIDILQECIAVTQVALGVFSLTVQIPPPVSIDERAHIRVQLQAIPTVEQQIAYIWLIVSAKLDRVFKQAGWELKHEEYFVNPGF